MLVYQPDMIAPRLPLRTAPAVFAGYRPELGKIKPAQWVTWNLRNMPGAGTIFLQVDKRLSEATGVASGERVLNVTTGSGSATLAQPESLPFRNAAFDVVLSGFAAASAADHYRMARELLRVCRRGGRIGLASWTPQGFNGRLNELIERYSTAPSALPSANLWGTREYLNELFGHAADALGAATRTHTWRYRSPEEWLDTWRSAGGPLCKAYNAVDPDWRDQFSAELLALVGRFNEADDGSMLVASEYLEFLVHKSSWRV